jgi:uncharacterized protein (DUF924 family)
MPVRTPSDILDFWFSEQSRALWFTKNAAFDQSIRERFEETLRAAAAGDLDHWAATAPGALGLIIVLDQFSRNIYRGSARAFLADARARAVASGAISKSQDQEIPLPRRFFFYVPFEHSESLADQERSVALFQAWVDAHDGPERERAQGFMPYIHRHAEIIQRFGRFPHRNEVLGRESTLAEIAFLQEPMSSF